MIHVSRDVKLQFRRIKANLTTQTTHFLQKALITRKQIDDSVNGRFHSFLSIFVPKLTPKYPKPCVMLHLSNGSSSCMCRVKNPETMIKILEDCIITMRSDSWMDKWWRLTDFSENIINNNQLEFNKELIDVEAWKDELITGTVDFVEVKKPSD